jgi:hypothetical protein
MGLDLAYRALLLGLAVALPWAAYGYARLFVSASASGIAALVVVFLPSVGLLNYTFGQLPTLLALVLGLLVCVSGAEFLRHRKALEGARTLALISARASVRWRARGCCCLFSDWAAQRLCRGCSSRACGHG